MRSCFFLLVFLLLMHIARSQEAVIHFASGSYEVPQKDYARLHALAIKYNSCSDIISIHGFADSTGTDERNKEISRQRAEAVQELLLTLGLRSRERQDGPLVRVLAFGKERPVANNATEAGRRSNRRVEISVSQQICEGHPDGTIDMLYDLLAEKGTEFCVNPMRDTALTGKNGSIVYYKAGTFANTGNCTCLRLVLEEYFDKASFIMNNLSTTSGGVALESGGMVHLTGFCGRDTLRFIPGKYLTVMVPTDTLLPGMKLLSANRQRRSDYLDWQLDKDFSTLLEADWQRLMMLCGGVKGARPLGSKCPLFFCRIRRFFSGTTQSRVDAINERMRMEDTLVKDFALNEQKLGAALLASKNANKDVLKYYVYKNANWDYHNIDRYMTGARYPDFVVEESPDKSKDVKLVYQRSKTVLPPLSRMNYRFRDVWDNESIWIIGLQYRDQETAFLSMKAENSSSRKARLDFRVVELSELKNLLERLK